MVLVSMNPPRNPNSLKVRFTKVFLRALMRIHRHRSRTSPSSPREIWRRYQKVKHAADASMALAAGTRRLWSQAVLRKLQSQARRNRGVVRRISPTLIGVKKRVSMKEKKEEDDDEIGHDHHNQETKLRKLVPGGKAMDICSLLDETAHYVKCLTTQVNMMRRIADVCSI